MNLKDTLEYLISDGPDRTKLEGGDRWAAEGWAAHIRETNHPIHTINSYLKHEGDFASPRAAGAALALTLARCAEGGWSMAQAVMEIAQRRSIRQARLAEMPSPGDLS